MIHGENTMCIVNGMYNMLVLKLIKYFGSHYFSEAHHVFQIDFLPSRKWTAAQRLKVNLKISAVL